MAIYTLRSGATSHPEDSVLQTVTDLIRAGGVKDLSSSNHWKVTEKSGTPDMSVDIAAGDCFIVGSSGNCYPVRNTTTINQTITANSSGNTRIDAVVVYVDLAATPNSDASNVAKIAVVEGTPSESPVAPTDSEIQTSIGSSNPFLRLADVTVVNNETQIDNADITDQRVQFRIRGSLKSATVTYSATPTFDVSQNNYLTITLTGNVTSSSVTGDQVDVPFIIKVVQGGSGGYTFAWWSNIDWIGGTPTLSTDVGAVDAFGFVKKSDGRYDGYILGQG